MTVRLAIASAAFGVCAVAMLVLVVGYDAYEIPSGSMEPTVDLGDRVLARRVLIGPGLGDVVIYADDQLGSRISRIVAVGGDRIEGVNGDIVRNGSVATEDFLPAGTLSPRFDPVEVPEGSVFVLGDNRGNSGDSRVDGPLDEDDVTGVVQFVGGPPWDHLAIAAALVSGAVWLRLVLRRSRRPRSGAGTAARS